MYELFIYIFKAKTVELDMKIPFISKLKRYTRLENPTSDFKLAEMRMLKYFNWYPNKLYPSGNYNVVP